MRPVTLLCAALVALSAAPGAGAAPTTLVRERHGVVTVAQDDGRIAWVRTTPKFTAWGEELRCATVFVRGIHARRPIRLRRTCYWIGELTLVGGRAIWSEASQEHYYSEWRYRTAALHDRFVRRTGARTFFSDWRYTSGDYTWLSGDDGTAAYAWTEIGVVGGDEDCEWEDTCEYGVIGGGVSVFVRGVERRIPSIGPAFAVFASAGRVAVPAGSSDVEVWDVASGTLVSSFAVEGQLWNLALDASSVVALVWDGEAGAMRIERRRVQDGALEDVLPVSPQTSYVNVEGDDVVYADGRSIGYWRRGSLPQVLWTGRYPRDVSLDAGRVVWAVGDDIRRGRILTELLPTAER